MSTVIRRGGCPTGKRQFPDELAADEAAATVTRKNLRRPREEGRTACRSYRCPDCGAWHVTSAPPAPRKAP